MFTWVDFVWSIAMMVVFCLGVWVGLNWEKIKAQFVK